MSAFVKQWPLNNILRRGQTTNSSTTTRQCENAARAAKDCLQTELKSTNIIEVERKFHVSESSLVNLEKLSSITSTKNLEDSYYCEELALQDRWLRQRNGAWELKIPVEYTHSKRCGTTVYRELAGPAIWEELAEKAFDTERLVPYAKFITERKEREYICNERQVQIVLDMCTAENGFQYAVGEIEILVSDSSEVKHANIILDEVARRLGLQLEHYADGKLMTFLREKNAVFYRQLSQKGLT